jgi:hypothetical protein
VSPDRRAIEQVPDKNLVKDHTHQKENQIADRLTRFFVDPVNRMQKLFHWRFNLPGAKEETGSPLFLGSD